MPFVPVPMRSICPNSAAAPTELTTPSAPGFPTPRKAAYCAKASSCGELLELEPTMTCPFFGLNERKRLVLARVGDQGNDPRVLPEGVVEQRLGRNEFALAQIGS